MIQLNQLKLRHYRILVSGGTGKLIFIIFIVHKKPFLPLEVINPTLVGISSALI